MKISNEFHNALQLGAVHKKVDGDEKIVRETLVRVWIQVLEKYAKPGMAIPPVSRVKEELLKVGVEAAIDAVVDAHWFVGSWMVRNEIQKNVKKGLDQLDLTQFLKDVKIAQDNPKMLAHLRAEIRHYVMHGF